ncbi:membrane-associated proteins in eicosanoid and glutathione metabolism [Violaceomyces palustris]|uniref:Membrane-associated proteins in eicosanoid and glutathione metabolism n=1 Tax=Violaceomyces palustris TaxID=1673888 RepID=A0ACD0NUN1_9BASI|nr:membrane-associated proteins in eicosanoid and glutathione metabolism [Violaceomyces palustris]
MSITVSFPPIPQGYGYVVLSVIGSFWLVTFQSFKVGSARKAAKIQYPQMYAELAQVEKSKEANLFNCAQRAHQNTLENLPSFIVLTLLNGLFNPRITTVLSFGWVFSRILYSSGYYSGEPKNRILGAAGGFLSLFGLLGLATYSTFDVIRLGGFKI